MAVCSLSWESLDKNRGGRSRSEFAAAGFADCLLWFMWRIGIQKTKSGSTLEQQGASMSRSSSAGKVANRWSHARHPAAERDSVELGCEASRQDKLTPRLDR